jgi:DNA-binding transcriptional LysR family regulator
LFDRVGRALELTDAGHRLYGASQRLFDEHARLLTEVTSAVVPTQTRILRVASFEPFTTHAIGEIVREELRGIELRLCDLAG